LGGHATLLFTNGEIKTAILFVVQPMIEALVCNRHGNHIVLNLTIRLTRADGPWLIHVQKLEKLLSWQQHNRCHFVSFVINIYGAKFEKCCFNISRDIVHSVFAHLMTSSLS